MPDPEAKNEAGRKKYLKWLKFNSPEEYERVMQSLSSDNNAHPANDWESLGNGGFKRIKHNLIENEL